MASDPPPLDAEESTRSALVLDRLRHASDSTGFLPYDRFMEIALYGDDVGFYHRKRSPLGVHGEFYTAAHVSPLFAATVAERIRAVRVALGNPHPFQIVELGPGDGTLASGVISSLAREPPGLEYVLVERSSERAAEAELRMRTPDHSIPIHRSESLAGIGPFSGIVLANEFLDAQPARRLRWDGTSWREMGVRVVEEHLVGVESEFDRPTPGLPPPVLSEPNVVWEVSPMAEGILREIADHLVGGLAILLDYGFSESELLRGHPRGTLAAVRHQGFVSDPLEAPGTSDLSTFVNFTRVRAAAGAGGLRELSFRSQAEALGAWGFQPLMESAVRSAGSTEAEVRIRLAGKNLLFGFERFRALELAPPSSVDGLRSLR